MARGKPWGAARTLPKSRKRQRRKAEASANTFAAIAGELAEKKRRDRKAAATLRKFEWFMSFAFPALGSRPIGEISAREVLTVLKEVEARGIMKPPASSGRRSATSSVMPRHRSRRERSDDRVEGRAVTPTVTPRAAIVAPKAFGGLLRAIEDYQGAPETRAALELLALTFVRPGELRAAEWAEFDLDAAVWEIPAGRMKMRKPHGPARPARGGDSRGASEVDGTRQFSFSVGPFGRPLHVREHVERGLATHGFQKRGHDEPRLPRVRVVDAERKRSLECRRDRKAIGHVDGDSVRRAYARAEFWDERVKMMTWWADRCDELRRGGQIISFPAAVR